MAIIRKEKLEALKKRLKELKIYEEDIEEKFIRSSGPGGQHINKTSTCVYLRHKPTGIVIKCQKSRSQYLNRFLARRILLERVEEMLYGESLSEKRIMKIRKQKQKRKKRSKLKRGLV